MNDYFKIREDILRFKPSGVGIASRIANCAVNNGCSTFGEFVDKFSGIEMLRLPNFGRHSYVETRRIAKKRRMNWREATLEHAERFPRSVANMQAADTAPTSPRLDPQVAQKIRDVVEEVGIAEELEHPRVIFNRIEAKVDRIMEHRKRLERIEDKLDRLCAHLGVSVRL